MRDIWNPWHGCVKYSEGCRNCYMYALDQRRGVQRPSSDIYKTGNFNYPLKKDRHRNYKIRPGERIRVNMTSDTFLAEAAQWLPEMWAIIKKRSDVGFWLLTKRVDRIAGSLPPDWGQGYPNVILNITCENQAMFDARWPVFEKIPAQAKGICCAPLLSGIDLEPALASGQISEISAGGENYDNPRPCRFEWYEDMSRQCERHRVSFCWYESGTVLYKDGVRHFIPYKHDQAILAGLSGLNKFYGSAWDRLVLTSTDDGHMLQDNEKWQRVYNSVHCAGCGNIQMCNGCDPDCRNKPPNSVNMSLPDFMSFLSAGQAP